MAIESGRARRAAWEPTAAVPAEAAQSPSRLAPPRLAPDAVLRRPRLLEALHAGLPRRATLLVAPAGYGKTTLLAQYAAEVDAAVAWCTLDGGDRDPRALPASLAVAVARRVPGFGGRVRAVLAAGEHGDETELLRAAAGAFVAELEEHVVDYLVLVVDDCQAIAGVPEGGLVLNLIVERLPDHCHLILAGRALPELPALPRLVARRQATRLGEAALRLTREETAGVAQLAGLVDLPADQAEALQVHTLGWPMAVALLAACAAEQGELPVLVAGGDAVPGTPPRRRLQRQGRDALFAFLAAEVLAGQPPVVQSLLLGASVLPYVDVERGAALLGRSVDEVRRVLAAAEARSLFVTRVDAPPIPRAAAGHAHGSASPHDLGGASGLAGAVGAAGAPGGADRRGAAGLFGPAGADRACYRFHDLFREFLLETLREQQPVRWRWLQRRAAGLAEAAGDFAGAVQHALSGRHFARAARLIERAAPECMAGGRWRTLRLWLDCLPAGVVDAFPRLLLLGARVEHALAGDYARAERWLGRAAAVCAPAAAVDAEIGLLRAAIFRQRGEYLRAEVLCREALATLTDAGPARLRAEAHFQLALSLQRLGRLPEACRLYEAAAALHRELGDVWEEAAARDGLATVQLWLGQLDGAIGELQAAAAAWRRLGNGAAAGRTLNNLGLAYYYAGDTSVARDFLAEAVQQARQNALPQLEACAWLGLGDVRREADSWDQAEAAYHDGLRLALETSSPYLTRYASNALSHLARLRGRLDRAEVLARQAVGQARAAGSRYEEGTYLGALALVHVARQEHATAQECLDRAVSLLEASGAQRELARARLYRAQVAFAARRRQDARAELAALGELLRRLGYHGFLLADARRASAVLDYGVASGAGGARLVGLRDAARRGASQSADAAAPAPGGGACAVDGAAADRVRQVERPSGAAGPDARAAPPAAAASTRRYRGAAAEPPPLLEAWALGLSHVRRLVPHPADVHWQTMKAKELFFYLLCHPGWQRRERIEADVWGDASAEQARSGFHVSVHRLRRAVHSDIVEAQRGRYRLRPAACGWFDAEAFGRYCHEAFAASSAADVTRAAQAALALYRGPFLDDLAPDWARPLGARLDALYLEVAVRAGRFHAALGDVAEAGRLAQQALAVDPAFDAAEALLRDCQEAMRRSSGPLLDDRRPAAAGYEPSVTPSASSGRRHGHPAEAEPQPAARSSGR